MKKSISKSLEVAAPIGLGTVGFIVAKVVNKIPTGTDATTKADTTLANSPYGAGLAKILIAMAAHYFIKNKYVQYASIGVGIAGGVDIMNAALPPSIKSWIGSPNFYIQGPGQRFDLGENNFSVQQA